MCAQRNPLHDEEMLDVMVKPCQTRHRFTMPIGPPDICRSSMSARILSTNQRPASGT